MVWFNQATFTYICPQFIIIAFDMYFVAEIFIPKYYDEASYLEISTMTALRTCVLFNIEYDFNQ